MQMYKNTLDMQDKISKNEETVKKPLILQGKLTNEEKEYVRSLSNYASLVNKELVIMGFEEVKPNCVHQVVGGFHSNSAIEVASRRIIKKFRALELA
jgi:hypothetical protein